MKIQFNTDKTILGDERNEHYFTAQIEEGLRHFKSHITRIEVHLSDQNGKKEGVKDILCMLEARIEDRKPIAVSCKSDTVEQAVTNAIDKLKTAIETIMDRSQNR